MQGVQIGAAKLGTKLLSCKKRLRAADCVFLLFFTADGEQLIELCSECNQKNQLTFSSIKKVCSGASAVNATDGGTLQTYSFF